MRNKWVIGQAIALILLFTGSSWAGPAASANPSFAITETKTTTEKVEAVDYATRKVTLKDESGNVRVVKAGDDVHNFGKMKIGDIVTVETFQTVNGEIQPGPGDTMNISQEGQSKPLPGEKPSGVRTIEGTLRTRIEAIDYNKRTITFKGRNGALVTYQIGPEAKRFKEIRLGDMLWVEYSQTIKLSVKGQ